MKLIVTGATGFVGEGVLLAALAADDVTAVLSVSRRPCGVTHSKLTELLVSDFRDTAAVESELSGYDGCLYCAGISSAGMSEADYTVVTYDTPVAFATTLARLSPTMTFAHVSGSHTDGTEKGRVMWARVKGRAENALLRLPFAAVHNFRPGLMRATPGQKHLSFGNKVLRALYPVMTLVFPGMEMADVGRAMIESVRHGAPKPVLEIEDMRLLAAAETSSK